MLLLRWGYVQDSTGATWVTLAVDVDHEKGIGPEQNGSSMCEPSVFIYEENDLGPPTEWSGLVSAEFTDATGETVLGPQNVDVDQAVSWGRDRAQIVTVRLDGTLYSAGQIDSPDQMKWTEAVPRPYRRGVFLRRGEKAAGWFDVNATFGPRSSWDEIRRGLVEAGAVAIQQREGEGSWFVTCRIEVSANRSADQEFQSILDRIADEYEFSVVGRVRPQPR